MKTQKKILKKIQSRRSRVPKNARPANMPPTARLTIELPFTTELKGVMHYATVIADANQLTLLDPMTCVQGNKLNRIAVVEAIKRLCSQWSDAADRLVSP